LSFRYDARQASLMDLSVQKHPADYDLCGAHADLLRVPRGWERLDRRTPVPEPQPEVYRRAPDEGVRRPAPVNRYAALTAELPRLAAALAAPDDGGDGPAAHSYEMVTDTMVAEDYVLEGQLQMPIEPEPEGVVVALTRTRQV
jgi:hypothetical protein